VLSPASLEVTSIKRQRAPKAIVIPFDILSDKNIVLTEGTLVATSPFGTVPKNI
jgi:hypothetical protein